MAELHQVLLSFTFYFSYFWLAQYFICWHLQRWFERQLLCSWGETTTDHSLPCQWWWQRTKASCVANLQTYLKGIVEAYCVSYNCQTMSKVHDAQHTRNVFLAKPCTHGFFCAFPCGFGVCPSAQHCHCALRLTRRNKLFSLDGHQSFWYSSYIPTNPVWPDWHRWLIDFKCKCQWWTPLF